MAAGDLQTVRFLPGRWVKDPTDLSAAYPYGGTELGNHIEAMVMPNQVVFEVRAEEYGNILTDVVDGGRTWAVALQVRGWDDDMIETLFPSSIRGYISGKQGIKETLDTSQAGKLASNRAIKLLHVPDDTLNHEATLLYCAIPLVDEAAEFNRQRRNETLIGMIFWAVPDYNGNIYAHQRLSDISLV